jgi:hypothetical protein
MMPAALTFSVFCSAVAVFAGLLSAGVSTPIRTAEA